MNENDYEIIKENLLKDKEHKERIIEQTYAKLEENRDILKMIIKTLAENIRR